MSLHPVMAAALRPFAPPQSSVHARAGDGINDDDVYVVHVATKRVLDRFGCKSALAEAAHRDGLRVGVGTAVLTGMQARHFGVTA